jgi:hypothetical protein
MKRISKKLFSASRFVAFGLLFSYPAVVYANQGLKALGGLFEIVSVVLAVVCINLVAALINLKLRNTVLKVVNIILTGCLVVVGFITFNFLPGLGFIFFVLAVLQIFLISQAKKKNNGM